MFDLKFHSYAKNLILLWLVIPIIKSLFKTSSSGMAKVKICGIETDEAINHKFLEALVNGSFSFCEFTQYIVVVQQ
jgi:hypothetical protein